MGSKQTHGFLSVWHDLIQNRIFCTPIYVLKFMFCLLFSVRDKSVCPDLYHAIHTAFWVLVLSVRMRLRAGSMSSYWPCFCHRVHPAFKGYFLGNFPPFRICTFVAENRPQFLRLWVEESNALTQNPCFRRWVVKKAFLKHDFPAPNFECRKSCLNRVGNYVKKVRKSAFARVASI